MAELKTKKTKQSVAQFIASVEDDQKRKDSRVVLKMMKDITGAQPKMWGPSIIGFGDYRYQYASGRSGDWFQLGFSPRKQALTLYLLPGAGRFPDSLKKLGKHTTGKGCLYIKRLEDVDQKVLLRLLKDSYRQVQKLAKAG